MRSSPHPRSGRLIRWAIAALVLVFLGLVGYQVYSRRTRFQGDAGLLDELAEAKVIDLHPAGKRPSDWPAWRGAFRDGVTRSPGLADRWPAKGPPRLWSAEGGDGYSSFAAAGGRAVSVVAQPDGREAVVCWDLATGKERWRHAHAPAATFDYGGPRSTPAIDEGKVYVAGSAGVLLCLGLQRGEVVWEVDLREEVGAVAPRWGFAFSPLVHGGLVYVTPGGKKGRCLAAFRKEDGQLAWASQNDPAGYSSPLRIEVAGVPQVVFFTGRRLLGVTPDEGKLLWEFPWHTQHEVNAATPVHVRAELDGKPLDYLFISSGYGKGCALVKVAGSRRNFRASAVYTSNELCCHFASPVRVGDSLYALDETRDLTCLDLRTGEVRWRQRGFQKGSLIAAEGRLIVLGEQGNLALVDASPEGYRERGKARPFRGRCWSVPALVGNRLLLRDQRQVLCLDVGAK